MRKLIPHLLISVVCLFWCSAVFAQTTAQTNSATISAVASADHVRITAPASIVQMRVEIYNSNGAKVWDSEIHGNVFDWQLQDGQAQRVAIADYVCVITVKNVAGRVSQRMGSIQIGEKDVRVGTVDAARFSAPQSQAIGPLEENASWTILTDEQNQTTAIIGHDGTDAEITRGRGAFSFRLGDFYSGKTQEQMRLTEEGNLGIGTSKPEFKLDVMGAIRARSGFVFNDGSTLSVNDKGALTRTDASGNSSPAITSGVGTQNNLAKWTDNAGTLGNSNITEASDGSIGIGTSTPNSLLNIQGAIPTLLGKMVVIRSTGANNGFGLQMDAVGSGNNALGLGVNGVPKAAFSWDNSRQFLGLVNFAYSGNDFALRLNVDGSLTYHDGVTSAERFRITKDGNVGIGTTSGLRLDVLGRSRLRQNSGDTGSSNSAGIWLFQNTPNADRAFVGMRDDNKIGFYGATGSGWSFVMNTDSGDVGIGTDSPASRLHLNGNSGNFAMTFTNAANTLGRRGYRLSFDNDRFTFQKADDAGNFLDNQVAIDQATGNVGIGTTTPGAKLDVAGNIKSTGRFIGDGSGLTNVVAPTGLLIGLLRWDKLKAQSTFPVGNGPYGAAFDGENIWVAHYEGGIVTKVRASDGADLGSYQIDGAVNLAFDGTYIWSVSAANGIVQRRRADDLSCGDSTCQFFGLSNNQQGIVFDGANIWVSSASVNQVKKLRASDGACVGTCVFSAGINPQALTFDGTNIWVVNGNGSITKVRASDGANLGSFPTGTNPVAATFDGAYVWVANSGSGTVTKLRASDGTVINTYPVGPTPSGITFDGSNIWVANSGIVTLTKLRASDGAFLGTFTVGTAPRGMAFDGVNVWVVNHGSNNVTKIFALP
ncbi:MAG TPA: YncE family protein [Pyrinomonadaceae bacterium]|jgi:hypothetical protein